MKNMYITTWPQLKELIGTEHGAEIEEQGSQGDPDWLYDILKEHQEKITPDSAYYIDWFHGTIKGFEINIESTYKSYLLIK